MYCEIQTSSCSNRSTNDQAGGARNLAVDVSPAERPRFLGIGIVERLRPLFTCTR